VYKIPPPNIAAVGFKMFYYHLTRDYFETLLDPSEASETMRNKFLQFSRYIDAHYEWSALYTTFGTPGSPWLKSEWAARSPS
jgi:hypothetical protein